jgi:hypothetical protein
MRPVRAQTPDENVQAYWQWSQTENESQNVESLDLCLEKIYAAESDLTICQKAVLDLTAIPLNPTRRALLFSLLKKISTVRADGFEIDFQQGLSQTHPELTEQGLLPKQKQKTVPMAEMKAWRKTLFQKSEPQNTWISLNGQPLILAKNFVAPQGTYQWSLLSSRYEPMIVVGTWTDFSLALKNLQPRRENSPLFPSAKPTAAMPAHLSSVPELPEASSRQTISSRSWLIPAVIAVGVGLAFALKDKQVTVKMPGQH